MTIGHRIKEARLAASVGREKLAAKVDVTASTILRWEVGESEPRISDVMRLADALGVTGHWLAFGSAA